MLQQDQEVNLTTTLLSICLAEEHHPLRVAPFKVQGSRCVFGWLDLWTTSSPLLKEIRGRYKSKSPTTRKLKCTVVDSDSAHSGELMLQEELPPEIFSVLVCS